MNNYSLLPQTEESLRHILKHYDSFKQDRERRGLTRQPMVVGVSGCQGSGKTTLCDTLVHLLKETHKLNVVNFSLDDVYLTHEEQNKLSKKHTNNRLYQQRGQAGSHDLKLTQETFNLLLSDSKNVPIPVYDKSKHQGKGDRLSKNEWKYVDGPFDIILFEGWMLGFKSIPIQYIQDPDVSVLNDYLKSYEQDIYPFFDIFIHLSPFHIQQVYEWRLEQEHHMKQTRNVEGLSDEKVKAFVDTYMPAYEHYLPRLNKVGFYGKGLLGERLQMYEGLNRRDGGYSATERHLRLTLDKQRKVIEINRIKEVTVKRNRNLLYPLAIIGVVGLIGYHYKSIINSFPKRSNK